MYDCYEVIIHGINVKEPFILWLCNDRKLHREGLFVGDREKKI